MQVIAFYIKVLPTGKKKRIMKHINVEFLVTYKLFLQHSFKVTVSPFLQTPLKSN